jgi:hypothetical protein
VSQRLCISVFNHEMSFLWISSCFVMLRDNILYLESFWLPWAYCF